MPIGAKNWYCKYIVHMIRGGEEKGVYICLSKFAQCWVPRGSVIWGSSVHKATSTMQNLKVTLIVTFETNAIRITSSTQAHMHHCITYLQIDGKVLLESTY